MLSNISWDTYLRLRDELDGPRLTYDNGLLEIEMPGMTHEQTKKVLRLTIEALADELGRDYINAGSTTFKREFANRGLEPDECYYLTGMDENGEIADLDESVPPDLAIEVDLSSGSIDKEPIYAVIGVREIWRWKDGQLQFRRLRDGGYADAASSELLPEFDPKWLMTMIPRAGGVSDRRIKLDVHQLVQRSLRGQ